MNTNSPQSIYSENECKQTLKSVLWNKALKFFAENSMGTILRKFTEFALGIFLGAFIYRPEVISNFVSKLVIAQNYAIPKIGVTLIIFFSRKTLLKLFKRCSKLVQKKRIPESEKLIDGIPVNELADYLIRNGNFRREGSNGVRETFGISNMEKFNRLANNLERRKIL